MKVTPVASPHAVAPTQPNHQAQQSAKARAVAMLTGQGQAPVPQNQNAIQPEETVRTNTIDTALKQAAEQATQAAEITEQVDTNTASEATTTAAAETEAKKVEADPALSRQFAQLARQEKALRAQAQKQEQAIKAREDALKAKEAEILATESKYKSGYIQEDRLKTSTLQALADAGVSYEQLYEELTQQMLNKAPQDPRLNAHIGRLEAKIQELEQKAQASEKTYQESQRSAYDAAIKQITSDVKALVSSDANFETIKATNSVSDVVDLIQQTYDKDGVLLTVEEAAQEVENYLVDEAMKMTRIEKIKKRLSPESAQTQKKEEIKTTQAPAAQQQPTQQMKTLTNTVASTRKLSAKERAILAFKGELK